MNGTMYCVFFLSLSLLIYRRYCSVIDNNNTVVFQYCTAGLAGQVQFFFIFFFGQVKLDWVVDCVVECCDVL